MKALLVGILSMIAFQMCCYLGGYWIRKGWNVAKAEKE